MGGARRVRAYLPRTARLKVLREWGIRGGDSILRLTLYFACELQEDAFAVVALLCQ
jgi:hypothetical protein